MVVGGYNVGHGLQSVEIISNDPNNKCSDLVSNLRNESFSDLSTQNHTLG